MLKYKKINEHKEYCVKTSRELSCGERQSLEAGKSYVR